VDLGQQGGELVVATLQIADGISRHGEKSVDALVIESSKTVRLLALSWISDSNVKKIIHRSEFMKLGGGRPVEPA
jgi:hypothetical protein